MKLHKKVASLVGPVVVAAVAVPGVAHASVYGSEGDQSGWAYSRELSDDGVYLTSAGAYQLGFDTCNNMALYGMTEHAWTDHLWRDLRYTTGIAVTIAFGATYHFCPRLHNTGYPELPQSPSLS
jgi:hypothetical protein